MARAFKGVLNMTTKKKKSEFAKLPAGDKVLMVIAYIILGLFLVAIILPVIYIILASFVDPVTLQNSGLSFDFSKWTTTAYTRVLSNSQIWVGFKNALIYSILFTVVSVVVTLLAAYPMSRADFKGRGFFNVIFVITMFFGGGLIPTYLLISNLGMLDTIWAIIIPPAFSVWNMIIARTYYMGIPRDLQEAAEIDGATEMIYFFKILLPVCTPIIATISMWQFVGMWNSYFDAMIYLNSASKQPLQLVLRAILIQSQPQPGMVSDMQSTAARAQLAELLKYATIIISSLPLMIMYPFFQKYFDNGIMAGAVKG
ncbi:MAG: carbohydrate ABC transporter permease [Oscillospiraceae bacterium]|nr:carbohydrate ABC transporter permease [Oscillospiraceae bacterium]